MVLYFKPPPDLSDLVWNAAVAAAEAVGEHVTPLEVLGQFRSRNIVHARQIVAGLLRAHVWLQQPPYAPRGVRNQKSRLAITFAPDAPFTHKRALRITTPMIAFLLGKRDHTTIGWSLRQLGAKNWLAVKYAEADRKLAMQYNLDPIYMVAMMHTGNPEDGQ